MCERNPSPALEGREGECVWCEPGAVCSSCVVVEGEGGSASGVTTNSEPSPGGETDENAARAFTDVGSWLEGECLCCGRDAEPGKDQCAYCLSGHQGPPPPLPSNLSQGEPK